MIKDFLKNSAIYGFGKGIAVILGFITLPIITHNLSPSDYGVFDLLNLCLILLSLCASLEISQAVARFIGDAQQKHDKQVMVSTAYYFSLGMYALCGLGIYLFSADLSNIIFQTKEYYSLILFLIPWVFLQGTYSFITNQFRWENKPKQQTSLIILQGLGLLISVYYFISLSNASIENLLYAYLVSLLVVNIIGFYMMIQHGIISLKFSTSLLRTMLIFSIPLVPSSLAVFGQNYTDRIMISNLLDLQSLGYYGLAFKIASILAVVAGIFQLSAVPLIYKHYTDKDASQKFEESANIYLFFILISIMGLSLLTPELFSIFIGAEFQSAMVYIPLLLIAIGLQSFYVFAPGLSIAKKTHYIAIVNIIGFVINIILNYLFISLYGLTGAAIATIITALVVCVANIILSQKHYPIPFNYFKMIIATILTLAVISTPYFIGWDVTWTSLFIKIIVGITGVLSVGYCLIYRMIKGLIH